MAGYSVLPRIALALRIRRSFTRRSICLHIVLFIATIQASNVPCIQRHVIEDEEKTAFRWNKRDIYSSWPPSLSCTIFYDARDFEAKHLWQGWHRPINPTSLVEAKATVSPEDICCYALILQKSVNKGIELRALCGGWETAVVTMADLRISHITRYTECLVS